MFIFCPTCILSDYLSLNWYGLEGFNFYSSKIRQYQYPYNVINIAIYVVLLVLERTLSVFDCGHFVCFGFTPQVNVLQNSWNFSWVKAHQNNRLLPVVKPLHNPTATSTVVELSQPQRQHNTTQPQHCSWVGHENDCKPHPTHHRNSTVNTRGLR